MSDDKPRIAPSGMARVLAARLVSAMGDEDRSALEGLAGRLDTLLGGLSEQAGPDLATVLTEAGSEGTEMGKAFLAGQLVFARVVAGQALATRPEDDFFALFREAGPRAILGALASEMRASDLADITGRDEAGVAGDLERMEAAGLVLRLAGETETVFSRTPNAMAMLANEMISGKPGIGDGLSTGG